MNNYKFAIFFIILISILIYINSGYVTGSLITKDVSEILPELSQYAVVNEINESYAKRIYQINFQHNIMELKYEIFKYPSLEDAEENYFYIKHNYSELSIINLGNNGFGVEKKNQFSIVVFRTLNLVVKVELEGKYASLDKTISYAKKIRI